MNEEQIKAIIELLRAIGPHSDEEIMDQCKEIYEVIDAGIYGQHSYNSELDILVQDIMAMICGDDR
jgi:hypothetical protein